MTDFKNIFAQIELYDLYYFQQQLGCAFRFYTAVRRVGSRSMDMDGNL